MDPKSTVIVPGRCYVRHGAGRRWAEIPAGVADRYLRNLETATIGGPGIIVSLPEGFAVAVVDCCSAAVVYPAKGPSLEL